MAKITSAHIGDLLHTWTLDDGGKLIVRELPDGAGFIWNGRHYHKTISVELWNADGEQVESWGLDYSDYSDDENWFDECLDDIQDRILLQWNIEGEL